MKDSFGMLYDHRRFLPRKTPRGSSQANRGMKRLRTLHVLGVDRGRTYFRRHRGLARTEQIELVADGFTLCHLPLQN